MQAKKNYDKMFFGGLVDRAKSFAKKNPEAVSRGMDLFGGRFGGAGSMSGAGLMGMLRDRLQQRKDAQSAPKAEYGTMVKKYRKGGMFYADQGDLLQTEKEKNKTSNNAELPGMDKVRAMALGDPRGGQAGQISAELRQIGRAHV